MKYLIKPGRCANGAQRDGGTLVHAVDTEDDWGSWGSFTPALCGTRPGRLTPGWSSYQYDTATCPRCLKKLARIQNGNS
jgi:hypothetical protein